ncbi:MAG: tail fiber domain-containing protein [bacterium]
MKHTKIFFAAVLTVFLMSGFGFAQDTTLTVASNGNVGIGTTNPFARLTVDGNIVNTGDILTGNISLALNQRSALFLAGNGDFNHALYNNFDNIDGEGQFDGAKWNVLDGLNVRIGADDSKISAFYIHNDGKIGVGTITPIWQVNVQNASPFGTGLVLGNESTGGRQWTAISSGELNTEGPGKYLLRDEQADAVRMAIDTEGKVGIGSFAPTEMLQVADFSTFSDNYITVKSAGGQVYKSGIKLRHFDETNGFTIYSDDASSGGRIGLHILRHHITFPDAGKLALFIDRLNGNVGFGTNTPGHPIEMASGAHVTAGGVWTNASSRALKENIAAISAEEAQNTLQALAPVKYNYKSEKDEEYLGFIAEDVPETVAMKDRKSLSPMDIVAVLTKVVQEQQKKIAELSARLDSR